MELDVSLRTKSLALESAIEALHKGGLTAIVKKLKADPRGKELLFELVEESLRDHVPEIEDAEVVPNEPDEDPQTIAGEPAVFQIALPSVGGSHDGLQVLQETGWVAGPQADQITDERPVAFAVAEAMVIVVQSKEGLRAFRNDCGHVGLPLDRAVCDMEAGTITSGMALRLIARHVAASPCRPGCWLGAPAPGGVALPAAQPAAGQFYGPWGVWLDDHRLVVCDSGNHRLPIWKDLPFTRHTPPDDCLGQDSLTAVEPNRGRGPAADSLYWPHGIHPHAADGRIRMAVADSGNNRVMLWQRDRGER